jgi:hypothetical protein
VGAGNGLPPSYSSYPFLAKFFPATIGIVMEIIHCNVRRLCRSPVEIPFHNSLLPAVFGKGWRKGPNALRQSAGVKFALFLSGCVIYGNSSSWIFIPPIGKPKPANETYSPQSLSSRSP